MIHSSLQSLLPTIRQSMQKHKILRGYIFGSAVRETFNERSDIDIVVDVDDTIEPVELGGHLWDLQYELESLLSRKVDLLTSRALKNKYFIKEVDATKELIYG